MLRDFFTFLESDFVIAVCWLALFSLMLSAIR